MDHGQREGWGLPPSVAQEPVWPWYWAGVESVTVRVGRGSLVVEPADSAPATRPEGRPEQGPDRPRREVGRLRWFGEERGYRFIESPSGEDRFFHRSGLLCDPAEFEEGLPLEFEVRRESPGTAGPADQAPKVALVRLSTTRNSGAWGSDPHPYSPEGMEE